MNLNRELDIVVACYVDANRFSILDAYCSTFLKIDIFTSLFDISTGVGRVGNQ